MVMLAVTHTFSTLRKHREILIADGGVDVLVDLVIGSALLVGGSGGSVHRERYEKVSGNWVIKYSKLTRTRIDLTEPDGTVTQANASLADVAAKVNAITGG